MTKTQKTDPACIIITLLSPVDVAS